MGELANQLPFFARGPQYGQPTRRARSGHLQLVEELAIAGIRAQRLQLAVDTKVHSTGHSPPRPAEPCEGRIDLAELDVDLRDVNPLELDLRPLLDCCQERLCAGTVAAEQSDADEADHHRAVVGRQLLRALAFGVGLGTAAVTREVDRPGGGRARMIRIDDRATW
jgi:hypothetical protein